MNSKQFSRLSVGVTYRFDIKKALLSQIGAILALIMSLIGEGNPPFGDKPFSLFSPVTIFVLINILILSFTIFALGSSSIRLFPTMLVYSTRRKETRIDFSRIVHVQQLQNKELHFFIYDSSGKETPGLKIKNCGAYANSGELIEFLKYLLKDKFHAYVQIRKNFEIDQVFKSKGKPGAGSNLFKRR